MLESLVRNQAQPSKKLYSLLKSDLGSPLPLHISLSSPLNLETQQRESFLARLTAAIRGLPFVRRGCPAGADVGTNLPSVAHG